MSPGLAGAVPAVLVVVVAACLRAGLTARRRATAAARLRAGSGVGAPPRRAAPAVSLVGQPASRRRPGVAAPASRRRPGVAAPAWLGPRLAATGLAVAPDDAFRAWLATAAAVVAGTLAAAGLPAAALAALVVAGAPCLAWRLLRHRGAACLEAALPGAVEAVAAGLRSGASLRQAMAGAAAATPGPLGGDLAAVANATERGAGLVAALEQWADRRSEPGVRLVVAALCLGAETGGAAAQAVDGVAVTLRQRLAAQAEARALATQARVSAVVIAAAPVAFCALSTATDPRSAGFLLRTPTGLALLASGLALDAVGALWMARLTRMAP